MAKDYAKSFYKSKGWLRSRKGYIDSVGGICERCKAKGNVRWVKCPRGANG